MKVYLLLGAIAMALTILLTPAVRWACLRFNILPPVRGRDIQKTPIPRLGGVAMTIALIVTMLLASRIPYMAPLFYHHGPVGRHGRCRCHVHPRHHR